LQPPRLVEDFLEGTEEEALSFSKVCSITFVFKMFGGNSCSFRVVKLGFQMEIDSVCLVVLLACLKSTNWALSEASTLEICYDNVGLDMVIRRRH
jgi:hypothetical protein